MQTAIVLIRKSGAGGAIVPPLPDSKSLGPYSKTLAQGIRFVARLDGFRRGVGVDTLNFVTISIDLTQQDL